MGVQVHKTSARSTSAPQIEATLQKTVFRILGTVVGGAIGYCVMLKPESATNPYAIMCIICTVAFFSSFPANTQVGGHSAAVLRIACCPCHYRQCSCATSWQLNHKVSETGAVLLSITQVSAFALVPT